ncbi:hypothetical protein NPS29_00360 [Pseudomonas putida]|uniref:hypothetical protein n=1 Tax=Pseudomonas putida TaxID=303 RepID=UPI00236482ED|nr:hypothetical protein [Pseudomonas putida]MDD1963763.1 hypothetical protein [Pseudomonas putida]
MPECNLELVIWQLAAKVYGESLRKVIPEILSSYRREPGLDDLTRLFESSIGQDAFQILKVSLADLGDHESHQPEVIELRYRKRWHLHIGLRRRLVVEGHATDVIRDAHFAGEVGL